MCDSKTRIPGTSSNTQQMVSDMMSSLMNGSKNKDIDAMCYIDFI